MILITSEKTHALTLKDCDANVIIAVILVTPGEVINYTEPVRLAIEEHFNAEEVKIVGRYILDGHSYHTILRVESIEDGQECVRNFHLDKEAVYALPTKVTVEEAKNALHTAGYAVEHLWSINDVQSKYECDDDTALKIMNGVLELDSIVSEIDESIGDHASEFIGVTEEEDALLIDREDVVNIGSILGFLMSDGCINYVLKNFVAEAENDPTGEHTLWIEKLIYEYIEHTKD